LHEKFSHDRPWREYDQLEFRRWLVKWFPWISKAHAAVNPYALVTALDDGDAPEDAKLRYHHTVLESGKRLVAFLVDAEAWYEVDGGSR